MSVNQALTNFEGSHQEVEIHEGSRNSQLASLAGRMRYQGKNEEEILKNLKDLETKIDKIENITRDLNLRYIDTQEFLARNGSNYKKIFDFLLTEISKIRDLEIENNKLLNIINRKTAKYTKHNKDEA